MANGNVEDWRELGETVRDIVGSRRGGGQGFKGRTRRSNRQVMGRLGFELGVGEGEIRKKKKKEASGISTCDIAKEGRLRESGGANTRANLNTGALHTLSMYYNKLQLKVIANWIWYDIDER
ncbi:receptor-like protein kinase [Pyrus ussuriensis x Pyrus communis]|uniref:Receptor-like protein kinase n=1 Tax=Pyrus ussuriensis x Pyrus communis TaxID=2448454 RepID=A0A5N5FSG4_9ROSA|nr:receptor-like protein kinase [Pyrus ussuriensis x Pyrus communis]